MTAHFQHRIHMLTRINIILFDVKFCTNKFYHNHQSQYYFWNSYFMFIFLIYEKNIKYLVIIIVSYIHIVFSHSFQIPQGDNWNILLYTIYILLFYKIFFVAEQWGLMLFLNNFESKSIYTNHRKFHKPRNN